MAQQVQYLLIDDLDGGEANETVTFGLDGVSYEVDLSDTNAAELRDALERYVSGGRRVGGRLSRGRGKSAASSSSSSSARRNSDTAKIRAWAKESGYQVNNRGRVSSEIREAYRKAHA